jgi:release factor glutamine methyltransferase
LTRDQDEDAARPREDNPPRLGAWLREATARLLAAGFDQAAAETRALARAALNLRSDSWLTDPARVLSQEESEVLERLLESRLDGVPVQYLTCETAFRHLEIVVGPGVFVPRPETEGLVDHVLRFLASGRIAEPLVLELGAGSGAILASILSEAPNSTGVGVEASPLAVGYAALNISNAGAGARGSILLGDLYAPLDPVEHGKAFHVIVSNPPYIPESGWERLPRDVRDFEPRLALLGGTDGLDVVRRIVAGAPAYLAEDALLALEIDETHGGQLKDLVVATGAFAEVAVEADLAGRPRYCLARTRRLSR